MIITGFHAIEEKIRAISQPKADASGVRLYYSKVGPRVKKILAAAEEAGLACEQTDNARLDTFVADLPEALRDHRGIVMELPDSRNQQSADAANIVDFERWLKTSADGKATVVILDRVTDPHNVGAIIRSCDQFAVNLVILPEHKGANGIAENEVISRASAGASAWVPVVIVNNLTRAAEKLKEAGFWIYGADAGGEPCRTVSFAEKTALIMGSEGNGISPLLQKQCDTIVSIPTGGRIDSLNVSVAAGVLLYEIYSRQK